MATCVGNFSWFKDGDCKIPLTDITSFTAARKEVPYDECEVTPAGTSTKVTVCDPIKGMM